MNKDHARLVLVISILLIVIVGFDFLALSLRSSRENQVPPRQKPTLAQAVNELGQVLAGCSPCFEFYLKDSNDNSDVSGATATLETQAPFTSPTWIFTEISKNLGSIYYLDIGNIGGSLKAGYTLPATVQISVSKDGYVSKTTSITTDNSLPDTVYLSKVVASPAPVSNETTSTSTKTTSKISTKATVVQGTIKNVSLPNEFESQGTGTTNLSQLNNPASVSNFTLETPRNKIVFNLPVDLSATDTVNKLKNIDNYVVANLLGVVSIDSFNLPPLNKPATITMKNLPFVKTPRVLVNGKEDPTVVSNLKYANGNLTFNVAHFSTFTAAPTVGITDPADGLETTEKQISLKGAVSDPTASVSARLNETDLGKLKIATSSGEFNTKVNLELGKNLITVTAVSTNGAKAVATVSATLLKVATNYLPFFVLIGVLAIIAALGLIWGIKKMQKPNNLSKTTWENTQPPKII